MTELDDLDGALLERMQSGFPLTSQPFAALALALDTDEEDVLTRVRRLKEASIIRQIGAIFDTRRLGYQSTLVAFHVADGTLETVAARINAHLGVSHNYARPHHYNLWFTLAVAPGRDVLAEIGRLARRTGVDDWLDLPAIRVFKIRTHFKFSGGSATEPVDWLDSRTQSTRALTAADIPFVRALQQDLAVVPRPFAEAARQLGLCEEHLLDKARELEEAGIMRRFAAVLRHHRVGYTANGMACWAVPETRIEEVGVNAARFAQVSHCYQRPAHPPRWPYNLLTMIHGRTRDEVETAVATIARQEGIDEYQVLYSTVEFKKERVRYFEEVI